MSIQTPFFSASCVVQVIAGVPKFLGPVAQPDASNLGFRPFGATANDSQRIGPGVIRMRLLDPVATLSGEGSYNLANFTPKTVAAIGGVSADGFDVTIESYDLAGVAKDISFGLDVLRYPSH